MGGSLCLPQASINLVEALFMTSDDICQLLYYEGDPVDVSDKLVHPGIGTIHPGFGIAMHVASSSTLCVSASIRWPWAAEASAEAAISLAARCTRASRSPLLPFVIACHFQHASTNAELPHHSRRQLDPLRHVPQARSRPVLPIQHEYLRHRFHPARP